MTKKILKNKSVTSYLLDILISGLGCILYAVSINAFIVPNDITPGGVSGISTILHHLFGTPVGLLIFLINIPLFILAWKFLGTDFLLKTAIVTAGMSAFIDLFASFMPSYHGDRLLSCIFGGLINGIAMALIFIRGATSGGVDILARLIRLKFPHISMGQIILFADFIVITAAGIVFKSVESALYAVIVIFIETRTIDYVMYGTGNGKMLMVFTEHAKEISNTITTEMKRGVSIIDAQGGYTGREKSMLICAVRSSEVAKLTKIIKRFDENPFIIVTEAGEILGEGFKIEEE